MTNEFGQPKVDMYFVVPMVGKGYVPVYVSAYEVDCLAAARIMNYAVGSEMFEVESLYGPFGVQFEMARDADKMDYIFPGDARS